MDNPTPEPQQVSLAIATRHEHYRLRGNDGWWKKIKKEKAKTDKFARQAVYGDNSVGWFTPTELGRTQLSTK